MVFRVAACSFADDPQKQRCKFCFHPDGFTWHVPDEIWQRVVPEKYRNRVLCLFCFDRFALAAGVDYTPYLSDLMFVGEAADFDLAITRRLWHA